MDVVTDLQFILVFNSFNQLSIRKSSSSTQFSSSKLRNICGTYFSKLFDHHILRQALVNLEETLNMVSIHYLGKVVGESSWVAPLFPLVNSLTNLEAIEVIGQIPSIILLSDKVGCLRIIKW